MAVGVGAAGKKKYWNCAVGHGTSDRQKLEESEPENIHIAINPRWALGGSADFNQQQRLPIPEDRRKTSAVWVGTAIFWLFWSERRVEKGAIWKGGGWLPETDAESNLSHAQFPQEGPGGGGLSTSLCVDWEKEEGLTDMVF